MKNSSFSALIYREYLICKKNLHTALISIPIFSVMPLLIALSLRLGNLTMLPESIVADIRAHSDLLMKMYAVIVPCMLCISVAEAAAYDSKLNWDYFRRTTPVSPARMALAKYVFYAMLIVVSFLLAVIALTLFTLTMDTPIRKTDIALILLFITCFCAMSVVAQLYIMLLRSVDKGMLAMLATLAAPIMLLMKEDSRFTAESFLTFGAQILPLFPVLLFMILAFGFSVTTLLYKRRVK